MIFLANEVKYVDQKWPADTPVEGEQLSVNGYYTGEHTGMPMQDGKNATGNNDPYYTEHVTVRYGTMMQDGADNANMPTQADITVTNTLTGCTSSDVSGVAAKGVDYSCVITPNEGFTLPASITVNNGGSALTATTHYTWTQGTGELKVTGTNITGNLEIIVTATESD